MSWLKELLKAAGKKQSELADHLGIAASRVSEMIRRPDLRKLQPNEIAPTAAFLGVTPDHILALIQKKRGALNAALAHMAGGEIEGAPARVPQGHSDPDAVIPRTGLVPTTGEVAAGQWLDVDVEVDARDFEQYPIAAHQDYPFSCQFGLLVKGNSMNKVFPAGAILHCVDIIKAEIEPKEDDIVIVQRTRAQAGLREVTAKRINRRGAMIVLSPDSLESAWKPIEFNPDEGHETDEEIRVLALVIGHYTPARRRK